jgi:replicative DNA helicase
MHELKSEPSDRLFLIVDTDAARQHLESLGYTEEDPVFLRKFPAKGRQGYAKKSVTMLSQLPKRQSPDGGMYFVVNGGGHKKSEVTKPRAFFWEYDDRPREEQISDWQKFNLPEPTIQVMTRKSVHSYLAIKGDCTLEQWDELQQDLLEYIDADRTLKDRSRVMRLAGAWHIAEDAEPLQCEIISYTGNAYTYEQIRSIVPSRPEPQAYLNERAQDNAELTDSGSLSDFVRYDLLPRFSPERAYNWHGHNWQGNRGGSKLRGCCPWHDSQSGTAFYVDQRDSVWLWRCPSCDMGGTIIEYRHRLSGGNGRPRGKEYVDLLKQLADEVGVDFPKIGNHVSSIKDSIVATQQSKPEPGIPDADVVGSLRNAIAEYSREQDPFLKALIENQIGTQYNIRGSRLIALTERLEVVERPPATSLLDLMPDVFESIVDRAANPGINGIPSGFHDLDGMTNGFQSGDLVIVAGRPAMGKSSFVANIATYAAGQGKRVAMFSLEMSKESIVKRLLSSAAKIELSRLNNGRVNDGNWVELSNAMKTLWPLPLIIQDTGIDTYGAIAQSCEEMSKDEPLDMVIIDYLQLIESDMRGDNRNIELSKVTRGLKKLAMSMKIPILCLSQLSRSVESRGDKRPMMSDLRDSGAVEQDADMVLMLYRDEYYNPETPDRGIAEVIITKHRNGPVGKVKLLFDPRFTQFRNLRD